MITFHLESVLSSRELPAVPIPIAEAADSNQDPARLDDAFTEEANNGEIYDYVDVDVGATTQEYERILPATKDEDTLYDIVEFTPYTPGSIKEAYDYTSSVKVDQTLPSDPSELTMEHLAKADPQQAQLWMLLQIQKMVQKMERMEDMYESVGYLRVPSPVPPNAPSVATEEKQPPSTAQKSPNVQPTRKQIYVNLSDISQKKGSYKPRLPLPRHSPPEILPKTFEDTENYGFFQASGLVSSEEASAKPASSEVKSAVDMYKKYPQQKMIGNQFKEAILTYLPFIFHTF